MTADTTVLEAPRGLRDEYASWSWEAVSAYPGKSVMHRLSNGAGETRFLKMVRHGWFPSACDEAERTAWARAFLPVPAVLQSGMTRECSWLLTQGISAPDATKAAYRADVRNLVSLLGQALRRFHEAPAQECPFQFRIAEALQLVQHRLDTDQIDPGRDFHPEFAAFTAQEAVDHLFVSLPDSEDLVVCRGDYCVPNVLVRGGSVAGYVDLGELGVADRWWDLAVATWSITWNFGPGYEHQFLRAYGVNVDERRMRFSRLLYDLVS